MKRWIQLTVLLLPLFILISCGQDDAMEDPVENVSVSEAPEMIVGIDEKLLYADRMSQDEDQQEADERPVEDPEEVEDDAQPEMAISSLEESGDNSNESNSDIDSRPSSTESSTNEDRNKNNTTTANSSPVTKDDSSTTGSTSNESDKSNEKNSSSSQPSDKGSSQVDKRSAPTPKEEEEEAPPTPKQSIATVSVESPSDLDGPNYSGIEVEISEGDTALDATLKALGNEVEYRGSGATAYVEAIGGLGEFDAGPLSGWNVFVDGVMIPRSADAWEIEDGATIHWRYTKNYLED